MPGPAASRGEHNRVHNNEIDDMLAFGMTASETKKGDGAFYKRRSTNGLICTLGRGGGLQVRARSAGQV